MNNDALFNNGKGNQFVISYELLALLRWIVENDADVLKHMISQALSTGLKKEIQTSGKKIKESPYTLEEMQHNIVDFFELLESTLFESLSEHAVQKALESNLMPAIDQIDTHECDNATVQSSIEHATNNLERQPDQTIKELLYKELLRQWEPKNVLN